MNHKVLICLALGGVASSSLAQTIVTGNKLVGQNAGANRFRNFGNTVFEGDNYLGIDGLGAGERSETNSVVWSPQFAHSFTFTYDTVLDRLVSSVTYLSTPDDPVTSSIVYNNFLSNVGSNANTNVVKDLDWNVLRISLTMDNGPTGFNLRNLKFNGNSLNVTDLFGVARQTTDWTIQSYDFRNGFSLTGTIELDGSFSASSDLNLMNFGFGNGPDAPPNTVPEPFTMGLGAAAAGAFVRRRLKVKA